MGASAGVGVACRIGIRARTGTTAIASRLQASPRSFCHGSSSLVRSKASETRLFTLKHGAGGLRCSARRTAMSLAERANSSGASQPAVDVSLKYRSVRNFTKFAENYQ